MFYGKTFTVWTGLYIHLVRPHLDYASQVWSPHQAYLSNMIEGVQRRATKLMVGSKLSYSVLIVY